MTAPSLTFFYIAEPPDYQTMACTLLASIRTHFPPEVKAVGYCPAHRMEELSPAVLRAHEMMGGEIRPMQTRGRFEPPYPHGNKILAACEPRDTEYSAFVDSDVLFLRPNSAAALALPGHVSCSVAASMLWGGQEVWATVWGAFGLPVPDERVDLMRRGRNVVPYFSSGLVVFPEAGGAHGRFPDVWYETAQAVDRIETLDARRPYLDQMTLPVAIRRAGLDWNILPEEQHFILGGSRREEPLPTDRPIYTVHYRNVNNLRRTGLQQLAKRTLAAKIGVPYVSRLGNTDAEDSPRPAAPPPGAGGNRSAEEEDFIARSVKLQLGPTAGGKFSVDEHARIAAMAASSASALAWCHSARSPYPVNGWSLLDSDGSEELNLANASRFVRPQKNRMALREIISAGADFDLIVDMQDRRVRSIGVEDGSIYPVFSFNRIRDEPGRVLWPLASHHDIDSPEFLGGLNPGAVPWEQKLDRFAWRGIANGRANSGGDVRREGVRIRYALRSHSSGRTDQEATLALLKTFPRYRFVASYFNDLRADVGFVEGGGIDLAEEPLIAGLSKARLTRASLQNFRYLVVLQGADVASSFYWTMNSGSLGLVMDGPFETFASGHFRPWEHFVPFRRDLSDFEDRLAWCAANQEECRQIAQRAADVCRLLGRRDLREAIGAGVVAEVRRRMS